MSPALKSAAGSISTIISERGAGKPVIGYHAAGGKRACGFKHGPRVMEDLKSTMPDGIEYVIALDTTDFVRISIKEVIHTLFEAILLVIVVVYFFLQSFRSTLICIVAIFVSLIGTFAGMLALGFSHQPTDAFRACAGHRYGG
jgi:multidrug efflux pump